MKKRLLSLALVSVLFLLTGCQSLDVIGNQAVRSFEALLSAAPELVSEDAAFGGYALRAPDDSARFCWSRDYTAGAPYDVMIEFDAKPFLDAGLDAAKLPGGMLDGDRIRIGKKLADKKPPYDGDATPLKAYQMIIRLKRDNINYHADLDHIGTSLGGGNMFEFAKDMRTNDKDIVFVLNPQPFIEAGVDPEKVTGWVFGKARVEDASGRMVDADKLLKPFDIQ